MTKFRDHFRTVQLELDSSTLVRPDYADTLRKHKYKPKFEENQARREVGDVVDVWEHSKQPSAIMIHKGGSWRHMHVNSRPHGQGTDVETLDRHLAHYHYYD